MGNKAGWSEGRAREWKVRMASCQRMAQRRVADDVMDRVYSDFVEGLVP